MGNVRPLPDTTAWQPKRKAADALSRSLQRRCAALERSLQTTAEQARSDRIENFDSGIDIEGAVRTSLGGLLPARYAVRRGVVVDRLGGTAGDCDVVIFNDAWFPQLRLTQSQEHQRPHLPIDGVYAVGEVKSRLDERVLDKAMEKLVVSSRLHRPSTHAYRVTENREGPPCAHGRTNPLYTFVLAVDVHANTSFDALIERFFAISRALPRTDVVRALCVLGQGTVTWGYRDPSSPKDLRPARFMLEDLYEPVVPVRHAAEAMGSAMYPFVGDLMLHLFHSVLAAEDITHAFATPDASVLAPDPSAVALEPSPEVMAALQHRCERGSEVRHP